MTWIGLIAGSVLGSAVMGVVSVQTPTVVVLPTMIGIGLLLMISTQARVVFVIFGGLLVLQRSQDLDVFKLIYLAGVSIALMAVLLRDLVRSHTASTPHQRMLVMASLLTFGLVGLSFLVSVSHGTPIKDWLRDIAPYAFIGATPLFALDLRSDTSEQFISALFAVAGVLSAVSFFMEWADRRYIADLGVNRLVLPSLLLPAAAFSYSFARALEDRKRRVLWIALAAFIAALLFASGTRTSFVLLGTPIVLVIMDRRRLGTRLVQAGLTVTISAVAILAAVMVIASVTDTNIDRLLGRFQSLHRLATEPESDPSLVARWDQTRAAWETFTAFPLVGAGAGHRFEWTNSLGERREGFVIDTGLSFLAKFGIAGLVILIAVLKTMQRFLRDIGPIQSAAAARSSLYAYAVTTLLALPLMLPIEDKGFGFGLLFILTLLVLHLDRSTATRASAFPSRVQPSDSGGQPLTAGDHHSG